MVRALLDGRKTQTRRIIKPQPSAPCSHVEPFRGEGGGWIAGNNTGRVFPCPYGQPGDRLWVKETHYRWTGCGAAPADWRRSPAGDCYQSRGYADSPEIEGIKAAAACATVPSIHMPRWASRITLEVTGVRVERLNDISPLDCLAEGISPPPTFAPGGESWVRDSFAALWESINGPGSWDDNPWVWVVEFCRVDPHGGAR